MKLHRKPVEVEEGVWTRNTGTKPCRAFSSSNRSKRKPSPPKYELLHWVDWYPEPVYNETAMTEMTHKD